MAKTPLLCYLIRSDVESIGGYSLYPFTDLWIFAAEAEDVAGLLEATVDNRAGYGNPETAVKMGLVFRRMLDSGITRRFNQISSYKSDSGSVHLQYRGYDPDRAYSSYDPRQRGYITDPRVSFSPDDWSAASRGLKVLDRVGKKVNAQENKLRQYSQRDSVTNWCFQDPVRVVDALQRMGAVRVVRWEDSEYDRYVGLTYVQDRGPRERFRSEGLLSIFGLGSTSSE